MSLLVYPCQLDQGQRDTPTQAATAAAHHTADVTSAARHFLGKGWLWTAARGIQTWQLSCQPPSNPLPLRQRTTPRAGSKGGAALFVGRDILDTL